jgi:hypothetical protein
MDKSSGKKFGRRGFLASAAASMLGYSVVVKAPQVLALRFGGQLRELTLSACASLKLLCQRVRDGARPYVVKKWGAFLFFSQKP